MTGKDFDGFGADLGFYDKLNFLTSSQANSEVAKQPASQQLRVRNEVNERANSSIRLKGE